MLQLPVCKSHHRLPLPDLVQADEVSFHTLLKVYDYAGDVDGALKVSLLQGLKGLAALPGWVGHLHATLYPKPLNGQLVSFRFVPCFCWPGMCILCPPLICRACRIPLCCS